jgi:hypothetical protein
MSRGYCHRISYVWSTLFLLCNNQYTCYDAVSMWPIEGSNEHGSEPLLPLNIWKFWTAERLPVCQVGLNIRGVSYGSVTTPCFTCELQCLAVCLNLHRFSRYRNLWNLSSRSPSWPDCNTMWSSCSFLCGVTFCRWGPNLHRVCNTLQLCILHLTSPYLGFVNVTVYS